MRATHRPRPAPLDPIAHDDAFILPLVLALAVLQGRWLSADCGDLKPLDPQR